MRKTAWVPGYVQLARRGELEERARRLEELMSSCALCPRECHIDRRARLGACLTGVRAKVASWGAHFGEEPVISGRRGSGTVFLANCNLACVFCQNHDISQRPKAYASHSTSVEQLAEIYLALEERGCHNINWVSPTHQVPSLARALVVAAGRGLHIPIVYNTNGYDSIETLRLLAGVVDVYMPDLKYAEASVGEQLSGVPDYPDRARAALSEMFRQVGERFQLSAQGVLERGLLVRMLVLPEELAGIDDGLRWLAHSLSPRVAVSLLAQYRPSHLALGQSFPKLRRTITTPEWSAAVTSLHRHMEGERHFVQGASPVLR